MEQQEFLTPPTQIELLIKFYVRELYNEIIFNNDSTQFWKKAQAYIFDNTLTSFREGVKELVEGMNEDKDMYNYFSAFCFRVFSQPYTSVALTVFSESFDDIVMDDILRSGFDWKAGQLTKIQLLLLFISVHRNEIMLMFEQKLALESAAAAERKKARAGVKRG